MNCAQLLAAAARDPLAGWDCSAGNDFLRLQTPMRYPDGDTIEVFAEIRDNLIILTDFGEASRFLATHGIDSARGAARKRAIAHAVRLGGAVEIDGDIEIAVRDPACVMEAAVRLGQIISRIADLVLTAKSPVGLTFSDQLEEFLLNNFLADGRDVQRNAPIRGLATEHRVDILVHSERGRDSAIEGLSAPTANGAASQVAWTVAKFADISKIGDAAPNLISVIDDRADVWTPPLRRQLETWSRVYDWDERDRIVQEIAA